MQNTYVYKLHQEYLNIYSIGIGFDIRDFKIWKVCIMHESPVSTASVSRHATIAPTAIGTGSTGVDGAATDGTGEAVCVW